MLHTVLIVIVVLGVVAYVIGRQLLGEPIRGKRLIVPPLILTVIGAIDLGRDHTHQVQAIDVVLIAIAAVVAAGIGAGQGAIMRLENRNGGLWGQLPVKGLWLWGAFVLSRLLIELVAHTTDAKVAESTAPLLLVLGINRLAQAAVVAPRAIRAGIPFAAEKDGTTFMSSAVRPEPVKPNANGSTPTAADPATPSWQQTGQQLAGSVAKTLQDRRAQRRGRDRRRR